MAGPRMATNYKQQQPGGVGMAQEDLALRAHAGRKHRPEFLEARAIEGQGVAKEWDGIPDQGQPLARWNARKHTIGHAG